MQSPPPGSVHRRSVHPCPPEEGAAVPGAPTTASAATTAPVPTTAPTTSAALGSRTGPTLQDLPCRRHPADLWFAELPHEVELAKELCGRCPIQRACLTEALERGEPWGVWGGQLVLQGRVVARKRPRGRPRKDEVAA